MADPRAKLEVHDTYSEGSVAQSSDVSNSDLSVMRSNVSGDIKQTVSSQTGKMSVFGGAATGRMAIICLSLIIIIAILYGIFM